MEFFKKHLLYQLVATFAAFQTVFTTGFWVAWLSVVLPKMKSGEIPIEVSESDITWIAALMDIGNLLSPIPAGYLMDRFGRLNALRLTALTFGLASTLAIIATSASSLMIVRFFAGVAKGISLTVAPVYVAEIAGPQIRGALSGIFVIMLTGGLASILSVGPFVSFITLGWISLAFPIALFFLSFVIPESPYYHYMRSDDVRASQAFYYLRGRRDTRATHEELLSVKKAVEVDMKRRKGFSTLFSGKANKKALIIVLALGALQRLGGISSILAYSSTTLPTNTAWDPKMTEILFGWASVVTGIFSMPLLDKFGRKPLLIISATVLALATGASAVFYFFYQRTTIQVDQFFFVPHVSLIIYGLFYSVGVGQVVHTLQSELFPINVKSKASALTTIVVSISSFILNKIYLYVDRLIGVYFMYSIFAISNLVSIIFTIVYVFETKGKTLEEIQNLLNQ